MESYVTHHLLPGSSCFITFFLFNPSRGIFILQPFATMFVVTAENVLSRTFVAVSQVLWEHTVKLQWIDVKWTMEGVLRSVNRPIEFFIEFFNF